MTLYGPDGPIDAPGRPRRRRSRRAVRRCALLDALAPGTERFAVHVHARQGRIAAAVRDQQVDGLTPLGADWVPAARPPARAAAGARRARWHRASDGCRSSRRATPTASCGCGWSASPARSPRPGWTCIEVRAGTVTDIDIAPFAGGEPVTVELDSDVPVTAGVLDRADRGERRAGRDRLRRGDRPAHRRDPGRGGGRPRRRGVTSTLLLTAPRRRGHASGWSLPRARPAASRTEVRCPRAPRSRSTWPPSASAESFALAVAARSAGSGPVLAVRQVDEDGERGPFVTSGPVQPGPVRRGRSRVVAPDLSTGLPPRRLTRLDPPGVRPSGRHSGSTVPGSRPSRSASCSTTTSWTRQLAGPQARARASTGRR